MAFTDHCDLYGAVNEAGINQVVKHLMQLRPSLFNYGTEFIANNPELLCHPIEANPLVYSRNNPILTVEKPLPVLGTNGLINLNYCLQLVDAKIDFQRNNVIELAPEIQDIPAQHFVLSAKACAGLGCPEEEITRFLERAIETIYDIILLDDVVGDALNGKQPAAGATTTTHVPQRQPPAPFTIPTRRLHCFCLEVQALCHIETRKVGNRYLFAPKMDKLEIIDMQPEGMENSIECYLAQVIRLGLLPRIRIALEKIVFDQLQIVNIAVKPASGVTNNPAIEDDELKVFIDMEVA